MAADVLESLRLAGRVRGAGGSGSRVNGDGGGESWVCGSGRLMLGVYTPARYQWNLRPHECETQMATGALSSALPNWTPLPACTLPVTGLPEVSPSVISMCSTLSTVSQGHVEPQEVQGGEVT